MARNYEDWLKAYVDYASFSEAPKRMHFWTGVSAIAGALRRRVWIDQAYFKWYSNHYIIIVAPPGIVSKSTTTAIGMSLLKAVPGINFGPDIVTWPALVGAFAACNEQFELNGDWHAQCALTLESSEFGNLLNPDDREMVDLLVSLWDSKQGGFQKITKASGNDIIENPWINMIACTTPAWIAGNFPEYIIGGGFTSRCLFVYTDKKEKFVAYPYLSVPANLEERKTKLVQDLEHIATNLIGPYILSPTAIEWGTSWYERHYKNPPVELAQDERFGGYIARKQTHLHKLAMVLAASQRDTLVITEEDLAISDKMITDLEEDMPKVFAKIGRSEDSIHSERFINFIKSRGAVPYMEAFRYVLTQFPKASNFEDMLAGAIRSGTIIQEPTDKGYLLKYALK